METVVEIIDNVTMVLGFKDSFNMSEDDYQRIEAALIKYADELTL